MAERNFPEWAGEQAEYVEPTQVVRSYGYDVFANPVSEEAMQHNNATFECVLGVEGEVANRQIEYENTVSASADIKAHAAEFGSLMTGITLVNQQ